MNDLPKLGFNEQTGDLTLQLSMPRPTWALILRVLSESYYKHDDLLDLDENESAQLQGALEILNEATAAYLPQGTLEDIATITVETACDNCGSEYVPDGAILCLDCKPVPCAHCGKPVEEVYDDHCPRCKSVV